MNVDPHIHKKISRRCALVMLLLAAALTALGLPAVAQEIDTLRIISENEMIVTQLPDSLLEAEQTEAAQAIAPPEAPALNGNPLGVDTLFTISGRPRTIYSLPASWTYSAPWWHGMWINTAIYAGAFISTLFVLECLPEDATAWNREEIQKDPFYKRWYDNIFKKGPEWDHDKFYFNYLLHPYAGAVYFMAARTCGFNFWQSMLYSSLISNIGWEFGIEACMERPSYQDMLITPLVGSLIGEGFYRLKRLIVDRDYYVLGSPVIGHILAFFLDPVNEVVGWLSPASKCRWTGPGCIQSQPMLIPSPGNIGGAGFSLSITI